MSVHSTLSIDCALWLHFVARAFTVQLASNLLMALTCITLQVKSLEEISL